MFSGSEWDDVVSVEGIKPDKSDKAFLASLLLVLRWARRPYEAVRIPTKSLKEYTLNYSRIPNGPTNGLNIEVYSL